MAPNRVLSGHFLFTCSDTFARSSDTAQKDNSSAVQGHQFCEQSGISYTNGSNYGTRLDH